MIGPSQRSLTYNGRQLQDTDINVRGGIRILIPSKRAAADPRFSPLGQRDRHLITTCVFSLNKYSSCISYLQVLWRIRPCTLRCMAPLERNASASVVKIIRIFFKPWRFITILFYLRK